ncbi:MAG: GNAT family N-acetyltransferase [Woeseiaceae bacterium]|nr:GNAT family N-acetyltransferase [Woeseiaceae bacterium]
MTSSVQITHEATESGGLYEAHVDDSDATGILSYVQKDADTIIADHTLVPDALRGRGIASALVKQLMADAAVQGFRIVPQCSFVRASFERHPEWAEFRAD